MLDFVSFDDKNLQRWRKFVGEHDFLTQNSYTWSGSMSESQRGPEICDIISAKRYLQPFGQEMFLAMNFIGISTLNGKWRLLGLHASDKFFWATPFPLKKGKGGFGVIVHKLQLFSGCQSHVLQLQIMKSIFKVPHFSIKTLLILTLSTHMTWCIIYPLHSFLATIYHLNYHIYSNKRPPPPPPTWATVRLKLKLKLNKY